MISRNTPRADEVAHDRLGCPAAGMSPAPWSYSRLKNGRTFPGEISDATGAVIAFTGADGSRALMKRAHEAGPVLAAAPELLAALEALVSAVEDYRPNDAMEDARAAIAKARSKPGNNSVQRRENNL